MAPSMRQRPAKEMKPITETKGEHQERSSRKGKCPPPAWCSTDVQIPDDRLTSKSGNFRYGFKLSKKHMEIFEVVKTNPYPVSPLEIARVTEIKPGTVRKYLRELERYCLVRRKHHGYYVSFENLVTGSRRMVGSTGLKIHGVRFRVVGVHVIRNAWSRDFEVAKLKFVVHKNETAEVFVSCGVNGEGLDYAAFRLLISIICSELNCSWDAISVVCCEFNNDYLGLQLDGLKAVTLRSFDGSFRRMYNRSRGQLRDEVKIVGLRKLNDVLALMMGNVGVYNILQSQRMLFNEQSETKESILAALPLFQRCVQSMEKLADGCFRTRPTTGSLKEVSSFSRKDVQSSLRDVHAKGSSSG
jgi:hypothetical protein